MVEVFKTDINSLEKANRLLELLAVHFPEVSFNFDLEDCDRILRAEYNASTFSAYGITDLFMKQGQKAEVLQEVPKSPCQIIQN
ncbi:hypothetical protein [Constantimarinum furrinae]|uniref:Uncharacterized protein n=1 Tax=Constantimarinum furrinae TaxID=2562285 RepID=A0A7G8PWM8_9FLAO|nr:hypothetical protein [Constantimarinum furrinae]QNJ98744.1 hypothetical protein ALE3EI_2199 [Constantimarinum furrinae]